MPRNHECVAIVNKLRENARKCKVDLVREDAGREQVTAMLSRIRRSSGPAAQKRDAEKKLVAFEGTFAERVAVENQRGREQQRSGK